MAIVTRNQPQGLARIDGKSPLNAKLAGAYVATPSGIWTTENKVFQPTGPGVGIRIGTGGYAAKGLIANADSFQLTAANTTNTVWDSPSSQVTVMAVIKRTGTNGTSNLPIFANNSPNTYPYTPWGLTEKSGSGQMLFGIGTGSGTGTIVEILEPSAGMTDGLTHVYIGTYDGATMRLYRDGVQVVTGTTSGALYYFNAADRGTSIGNYFNFAGTRTFFGEVYTGGLWGRALSVDEVKSLSANPYQIFQAPQRPLIVAAGANTAINPAAGSVAFTGFAPTVAQSVNLEFSRPNHAAVAARQADRLAAGDRLVVASLGGAGGTPPPRPVRRCPGHP